MRTERGTKLLSLLALALAVGAVYRVFFGGAESPITSPAFASPWSSGDGKFFLWELLPGFRERRPASSRYHMPLEGRVVQAFQENGSGVVFETGYRSPVAPIGVGWVRKVMETPERGFFVEVKHGDGTVSRYGFLGEVYVREGDFVYPDRPLGVVKARTLYLEVRRFDVAVDPLDVLAPAERPGRGE
ncbi:MAG: peptidoglycan DD-metalloendopeptidase family protein [Brockia lithotrophica]|nr:peptidoglycan DD-metalloendopeptidase family protein [Brockia lithotrophica]